MKVKELIEELQKLDPEGVVYLADHDRGDIELGEVSLYDKDDDWFSNPPYNKTNVRLIW